MNIVIKCICRSYQLAFRLAMPFLPYREPERFDRIDALPPLLERLKIRSVLLVTDRPLREAGVPRPLEELLPIGLELYGLCVYRKLWELGRSAGIVDEATPEREGAEASIAAIRGLNQRLNIPEKLPEIRREDVPAMAAHAAREASPSTPFPS